MKDKILSIQSKLIYGYVGSNIAELAIQLNGLDVISFPTVLLSTHTGHQPVYGKATSQDLFDELIKGIEAINVIPDVSCIISGYIGTEDILASSSRFIQNIKKEYSSKSFICDPVMGDTGGLYVPEVIAENIIHQLIPYCDLMTPNHFELGYILKKTLNSIEDIETGVKNHSILSKKTVIATSCHLEDTPANQIETIIFENGEITRIKSKKVTIETTGTGDLFSALLASKLTLGNSVSEAVKYASDTISNILEYMLKQGNKEMNAACLIKYI